ATIAAAIQHMQLATKLLQYYLCRITVIAVLILPFASLQGAFNIYFGTFSKILLRHFCEIFVENDHTMPLGAFSTLTGLAISPTFRRRNAQIGNLIAGI